MQPFRGTLLAQMTFAGPAWALWLAIALLRWLRWVWQSLTLSGGWRRLTKAKAPEPPAAP